METWLFRNLLCQWVGPTHRDHLALKACAGILNSFFSKIHFIFNSVSVCVAIGAYTHDCRCPLGSEEATGCLELEQAGVSCWLGVPESSGRAANACDH